MGHFCWWDKKQVPTWSHLSPAVPKFLPNGVAAKTEEAKAVHGYYHPVWPDLAKFRHIGKIIKVFFPILDGLLNIAKILNPLGHIFTLLTIWSHSHHPSYPFAIDNVSDVDVYEDDDDLVLARAGSREERSLAALPHCTALRCTALQCAPFSDFFLSMARLFRWFVRSWGSSKSKILSSLNRGLKWFCTGRRRRRLIRECSVMIWFSERFSEKTKNLWLVELHTFWSNFYVWCCCWLTDNLFGPFYKKKQKKKIPSQMKKTVLEVSRGMSR